MLSQSCAGQTAAHTAAQRPVRQLQILLWVTGEGPEGREGEQGPFREMNAGGTRGFGAVASILQRRGLEGTAEAELQVLTAR